jgi:hypothetical protein
MHVSMQQMYLSSGSVRKKNPTFCIFFLEIKSLLILNLPPFPTLLLKETHISFLQIADSVLCHWL